MEQPEKNTNLEDEKDVTDQIAEASEDVVEAVTEQVEEALSSEGSEIIDDINENAESVSDAVEDVADELVLTADDAIEEAEGVVEEVVEDTAEVLTSTADDAVEQAEEAVENTTEAFTSTADDAVEQAEEVVEDTTEALAEMPSVDELVADVGEGVEEAIADASETVEEVIADVNEEVAEYTVDETAVVAEVSEPSDAVAEVAEVEEATVVETVATSEDAPETPEVVDNGLRRGDVLEGKIVRTSPTAVIVDLGEGLEGMVPGRELEMMSRKMLESLQPGEPITVYVVNPLNHRGTTVLSINLALEELDWRKVQEYRKSKEIYEDRVSGYNKGGLIVRFGRLRGFVPRSQVSDIRLRQMSGETPEQQYGRFVGEPISVKVMEVDRRRNRLIFSERAATREVRQQRKETLVGELEIGEIREGTVVSLESFGAFVDIGGAEGLVHLTELSWMHITHPRQVLSVGDPVQVKVINLDKQSNRIGLSIRQLQDDPWDTIAASFKQGQLVQGSVTKLSNFGAFIQLENAPDVEGLVHISELSDERVEHPREVVTKNDALTLRIIKIDVKNRRLGLSLKRVNSAEYLDLDMQMAFEEDFEDDGAQTDDDEPSSET